MMKKLMLQITIFTLLLFAFPNMDFAQGQTIHAATIGHNVVLTWSPSPDGVTNAAIGYNVYRSSTTGTETAPSLNATLAAAGCTNTTTCTYTDTTVVAGTTVFYVIRAKDPATGLESANSNEASATIPVVNLPPTAPTRLSAAVVVNQ